MSWNARKLFSIVAATVLLLVPVSGWAQNVGISGRVTDTTGAVLPGVNVEAKSPALIEGVRTAVTDEQGLFTIINLPPGNYTVTFQLQGFSGVIRDGIVLSGSRLATVNAEMAVGAVAETITVSGDAPLVDTRNVAAQVTLDEDLREALPSGRSLMQLSQLVPGMRISIHDVGGSQLNRGGSRIHGSREGDQTMEYDGARLTLAGGGGNAARNVDPLEMSEFRYETSGISAETSGGGVRGIMVPKEGGNTFSGGFFGSYTNQNLVADNATDELKAKGLREAAKINSLPDLNVAFGGPIKRNKLWFFSSTRHEGMELEVPGAYHAIDPLATFWNPRLGAAGNADLNKNVVNDLIQHGYSGRITWQASQKNKFALYASHQNWNQIGLYSSPNRSFEADINNVVDYANLFQGKWTAPVSDRLLLEAMVFFNGNNVHQAATREGLEGNPNILAINELSTGTRLRADSQTSYGNLLFRSPGMKATLAYVTGSHTAKFGFDMSQGYHSNIDKSWNGQVTLNLFNAQPVSVVVQNGPYTTRNRTRTVGFFAQDQWTLNRLTVNAGVRYDGQYGWINGDENMTGPSRWAPRQTWLDIKGVPDWKDISPRLGVAYDLFGDSRTALKASASRYVTTEGATGLTGSVNPALFNLTATRPWTDSNRDLIPQDNELGGLSNANFATATRNVSVDDSVAKGWGNRTYNWEFTGGIQHQLTGQLSASAMYIHRMYRNFRVTDNVELVPADYDEYCVTAPSDSRLGSVSGGEICGLYDLNPSKRGLSRSVITSDKNFGTQKESYSGADLTMNLRTRRVTVSGGLNIGTEGNNTDTCFVIDSPQQLLYCDVTRPWLQSWKFLGTTELPYGIVFSGTLQSYNGPEILASYTVRNADIGRTVRFKNPARTSFINASATIPLLQQGTVYSDQLYQVDVRLMKVIRAGRTRLRVALDMANLLNASTILGQSNNYGSTWLTPSEILVGRIFKPSIQFEW